MIGHFPSLKMKRMVAFESLIEQDYLYVLDYEREVDSYEEQPLIIEYIWQGKIRHYTPDFHAVRNQHHELVECKPQSRLHTEENQRKFVAARQWCQESGWNFSIVTDGALRNGPRLANIKILTRYARLTIDPNSRQRALVYLQQIPSPTLAETAHILNPTDPRQGIATLLCLAFHHQINLSLITATISPETRLTLP